jgi:hypothetical protein
MLFHIHLEPWQAFPGTTFLLYIEKRTKTMVKEGKNCLHMVLFSP